TLDEYAIHHLPWLAAASGKPAPANILPFDPQRMPETLRWHCMRALAEFSTARAPTSMFAAGLADESPRVRLAALAAVFNASRDLPLKAVLPSATSTDTYLRQTAARVLAQRAALKEIEGLLAEREAATRLAGVLAAGFRLTFAPPHRVPPPEVALSYPK